LSKSPAGAAFLRVATLLDGSSGPAYARDTPAAVCRRVPTQPFSMMMERPHRFQQHFKTRFMVAFSCTLPLRYRDVKQPDRQHG
jgi:hypothetical protein